MIHVGPIVFCIYVNTTWHKVGNKLVWFDLINYIDTCSLNASSSTVPSDMAVAERGWSPMIPSSPKLSPRLR